MRELFRIGHISIRFFGVMIALGLLAGVFLALKEIRRKKINEDKAFELIIFTVLAAIIGARLYYILGFNLDYFIKNPGQIFAINAGGLSIQGALIFGVLFAVLYSRLRKISFLDTADAVAPSIAIGQAIGRIGCDVFGVPMKTIYPWGIEVQGQILHPAQMYEMVLDLILFIFLWNRRGKLKYRGQLFINYIIGFSINRAFVEFFRTNPIAVGPFTIAHVTSAVLIITAIIAGKIIKSRFNASSEGDGSLSNDLADEAAKMPFYQYLLVLALAIVGMVIYYYMN